MPLKLKIVLAGIVPVAAYGLGAYSQRRKYIEICRALIEVGRDRDHISAQMGYLVNVLNENDVVLDEFDLIALNDLITEES